MTEARWACSCGAEGAVNETTRWCPDCLTMLLVDIEGHPIGYGAEACAALRHDIRRWAVEEATAQAWQKTVAIATALHKPTSPLRPLSREIIAVDHLFAFIDRWAVRRTIAAERRTRTDDGAGEVMHHDSLREIVVELDHRLQKQFGMRVGVLIVFSADGVPQTASPFDEAQRASILQELLEQHATELQGRPMQVRLEPITPEKGG